MELLSEIHKTGTTVLLVTHNPELTRYATRVVYMRDGIIIHDEETKLGEVAPRARKEMYNFHLTATEEDDLAGVSILMKAVPVMREMKTSYRPKTKKTKKTKRKPRAKKA
jgi:ABC-type cobalamin/Fe3+-siderophores transport system ATPase subunit